MSAFNGFLTNEALSTSAAYLEVSTYRSGLLSLAKQLIIYSKEDAYLSREAYTHLFPEASPTIDDLPYHLNLRGEYSPLDQLILVTSLDTNERIPFTKESLASHPNTLLAYQTNSDLRTQLITAHLDRKTLIYSIIAGLEIPDFSVLEDNQIIYYPKRLVEANEYTLIDDLQQLLYHHRLRWHNEGYLIDNDLYRAGYQCSVYTQLPGWIANLREDRVNTPEAHSFHVKQALASGGLLSAYYDALTDKQRMFLYLNLRYLNKNPGTNHCLELLIKGLYNANNLPISAYYLTLVNPDNADTVTIDEDLSDYSVNIQYLEKGLAESNVTSNNNLSSGDYYALEKTLLYNDDISDEEKKRLGLLNSAGRTRTSQLLTLVYSKNNYLGYGYDEFIFDHLAVTQGSTYSGFIDYEDIAYTPEEAFHLLYWGLNAVNGVPLVEFPAYYTAINAVSIVLNTVPSSVDRRVKNTLQSWLDNRVLSTPQTSAQGFYAEATAKYAYYLSSEKAIAEAATPQIAELLETYQRWYWSEARCYFGGAGLSLTEYLRDRNLPTDPAVITTETFISGLFRQVTGHYVNYADTTRANLAAVNAVTQVFMPYDLNILTDDATTPLVTFPVDTVALEPLSIRRPGHVSMWDNGDGFLNHL